MTRTLPITLIALALAAGSLPAAAGQESPIRWTFKAGDILRYRLNQDSTTKTNFQGNAIEAKNEQTFDLAWTVKSVNPDGSAQVVETFDRVRFKAEGPFGKLAYDSMDEKPGEGPAEALGKVFGALVGGEIAATITPEGDIKDIKLPAKAIDAINGIPAGPGGQRMLSEDSLKTIVEQSSQALPGKSVAKGATWDKTRETVAPLGTMTTITTYTYEGKDEKDGSLDRIVQTAKLDLAIKPEIREQIKATIKAQDVKGTVLFDPKTGRVKSSLVDQDVKLDLEAMGQSIEQQTITRVALTGIDAETK